RCQQLSPLLGAPVPIPKQLHDEYEVGNRKGIEKGASQQYAKSARLVPEDSAPSECFPPGLRVGRCPPEDGVEECENLLRGVQMRSLRLIFYFESRLSGAIDAPLLEC